MAKSRARKLADIIVGAGIDIDGNLTFDGGSTSADLTFADNDKANFGDASDLQIYHDGSNSYIKDAGTGDLIVEGSNNIWLMKAGGSEVFLNTYDDGAVQLYHDNSVKFATTSTGATITGTLVVDSLNLGDNEAINIGTSDDFQIYHNGSHSFIKDAGTGDLYIGASNNLALMNSAFSENYLLATTDGAVTLYYDGSSKLATASTGIDVTGSIDVTSSASYGVTANRGFKSTADIPNFTLVESDASGQTWQINSTGAKLSFRDISRQLDRIVIDTAGNVGIGESSPQGKLHLKKTDTGNSPQNPAGNQLVIENGDSSGSSDIQFLSAINGYSHIFFGDAADANVGVLLYDHTNNSMQFTTNTAERMRIDSSGQLMLGTTSGTGIIRAFGSTGRLIIGDTNNNYYDANTHNFRDYSAAIKMVLDSSGRLGIGTTSPDSKLHISGAGNTNIKITAGANSSASLRLVNDAHDWDVNCQTTDTFAIYSHTDGVARLAILPTSGNVGIGTTSPQAKLHIEGDGTYASIRGYSQVLDLGNWTNGEVRIESTGAPFHLRAAGNQPLHLETDNVERVTVLGTGNVGIGTTSPDYKLEVVGDSLIGDATAVTSPVFGAQQQIVKSFTHGQYGIGRSGNLYLLNTNTSGEAGFLCFGGYSNHTNNLYYQTGGIGGGTEAQDGGSWGGYLNFWTTSDGTAGAASGQFEHMRITADGNVGIGTASPDGALHVHSGSAGTITAAASANNLVVENNGAVGLSLLFDDSANNAYGNIYWGNETDGSGDGRITYFGSTYVVPADRQSMNFHTAGASRMRIDSNGNLLVGTTSTSLPSTDAFVFLAQNGEFRAGNDASSGGSNIELNRENSDGDFIRFFRAGSEIGSIGAINSNNLKIGGDVADHAGIQFATHEIVPMEAGVDSNGTINLGSDNSKFKDLYLSGFINVGNDIRMKQANPRIDYDNGSSGSLRFFSTSANTERMRLTSSGNVGIGTTSPDTNGGTGTFTWASPIQTIAGSRPTLFLNGSSVLATIRMWPRATDGTATSVDDWHINAINEGSGGYLSFAPQGGGIAPKGLHIKNTGNVGIGTISPAVELDIKRHTNSYPLRIGSETGEGRAIVFADVAGTPTKYNWIAGTQYNVDNSFEITPSTAVGGYTFGTPALVVRQSGNVGIGTTSPEAKLQVNGATQTFAAHFGQGTNNSSGNWGGISLGYSENNNNYRKVGIAAKAIGDGAARQELHFLVDANTDGNNADISDSKMMIDTSGNVGIGTTNPSSNGIFSVSCNLSAAFMGHFSNVNGSGYGLGLNTSSGNAVFFYHSFSNVGSITTTSTYTSYATTSDVRLKENIVDAPSASEDIDAIQVRSFDWKADGSHQKYGMVAQELAEVLPSAVNVPEEEDRMQSVDYSKLVPMLVKEVQSLRARVAELEGEK